MAQCSESVIESQPDWVLFKENFKEQNEEVGQKYGTYKRKRSCDICQ